MTNAETAQRFGLLIDSPQGASRPIKTLANCLQNVFHALNKILRLRKDFRYRILQLQPIRSSSSLRDISGKATSVNKLAIFPIDVGVDSDKLYGTVFATHSGIVLPKLFANIETRENVFKDMPVSKTLGDMASFIFLASVAKHIQLGLIYAKHSAVMPNP